MFAETDLLPSGLACRAPFLQGEVSDATGARADSAPSLGCRDPVLLAPLCLWLERGWVRGEAELRDTFAHRRQSLT